MSMIVENEDSCSSSAQEESKEQKAPAKVSEAANAEKPPISKREKKR